MTPLLADRWQFGFTITFHYLFPQLTMGLALLIFVLKTIALRTGSASHEAAARFWAKIFAISFAMGVVTGIPMEFQFGTNWSRFPLSPAISSARPSQWKAFSRFSWSQRFLGFSYTGGTKLARECIGSLR